MEIKIIGNEQDFQPQLTRDDYVDFLFEHLGEFGDPRDQIELSLDYAFSDQGGKGGFLLAALEDRKIIGAVVMNKTGMKHYIPENILVYVAVHVDMRGHGIGGKLIKQAIELSDGNVALHVEYDNPAKRLYEKIGFTSKYAEMRFDKG